MVHSCSVTFTTVVANSADDKLMVPLSFFFFFQKIGFFFFSCKLSPKEIICMNRQSQFPEENKNIILKCRLLKATYTYNELPCHTRIE